MRRKHESDVARDTGAGAEAARGSGVQGVGPSTVSDSRGRHRASAAGDGELVSPCAFCPGLRRAAGSMGRVKEAGKVRSGPSSGPT